jgi:hypothetical protein
MLLVLHRYNPTGIALARVEHLTLFTSRLLVHAAAGHRITPAA